jgi:sugar lactone lactonase YvrE
VVVVAAAGAFGASGGGTITTIAGNGKAGFSGDGGPATRAQLSIPSGVAVDAKGTVYIADTSNNRVRKVSSGGTITTFAGTNEGSLEDGGLATSARLIQPVGLAVDRQGSVYIAEYGNARVRKVSSAGTITTIAGTGRPGFSGDGAPATRAQLTSPEGVAVDGKGNVYVADSGNGRVRKVSPGGIITTFAGGGSSLGDGGPATSARLSNPQGLAVDGQGSVYIADWGHYLPGAQGERRDDHDVCRHGRRMRRLCHRPFHRGRRPGDFGAGVPALRGRAGRQGNLYVTENGRSRVRKVGRAPAAALKLTLGGAPSQRLLTQQAVTVTARCNRPCSLAATGSVAIVGTRNVLGLTRATANLAAAGSTTLTLRFPAAAKSRFRSLLKPGRQARATVTVRAVDKAGHSVSAQRLVVVLGTRGGAARAARLARCVPSPAGSSPTSRSPRADARSSGTR